MKKVLITGAGGFVGAHLCRYLSQKKYRVFAAGHNRNQANSAVSLKLDVTNQARIFELVRELRPDFICHLAALSVPRTSWTEREKTFDINVGGTIHLLEAVRRYSPSTRILFMSSAQIYGRHFCRKHQLNEKCPPWPENPYAFSKAVAELACFDYSKKFGVDVFVIRTLNITGIKAREDLAFSEWCAQIARAESARGGREIAVGDLSLKRDFLHADDAVRAMELLLRRAKPGEVYNLASGVSRPLADYMRFLIKKSKVKVAPSPQERLFRESDPAVVRVDTRKIRALGWRPQKSSFAALEELLNEFRKRYG